MAKTFTPYVKFFDGMLEVYTPYLDSFVRDLHNEIDQDQCRYNGSCWLVFPSDYNSMVIHNLIGHHYHVDVQMPQPDGNTRFGVKTRGVLEVHYIGAVKLRQSSPSDMYEEEVAFAMGPTEDWNMVFPKHVLQAFFHDRDNFWEMDFYGVLGMNPTDPASIVKSQFRLMALKYHPDVSKEADATQRFQRLNEAYSVINDPSKRARYDIGLRQQAMLNPPTVSQKGETKEYRPPMNCGMVDATYKRDSRAVLTIHEIHAWDVIRDQRGRVMVSQWFVPKGAKKGSLLRKWIYQEG